MKHFLFLCLVLAACIANAQMFTTTINSNDEDQQQVRQPAAGADPNLQMTMTTTEAQAVQDCVGCSATVGVPKALASVKQTGEHLERVIAEEGWQNKCDGFVKDGQIGLYGQIVREEIMKPASFKNIKKGDEDLSLLCPNFNLMNNSSKANVVLLVMTSAAFEESTCNNDEIAKGPNGTARGFFQLHYGRESTYSPDCKDYDSRTARGSITCALKILDLQMSKGNMFRQEENYWDVLRPLRWDKKRKKYFPNPSYAQIRSAISSFEPCNGKQSVQSDDATASKQLFLVMDQKYFHKSVADN